MQLFLILQQKTVVWQMICHSFNSRCKAAKHVIWIWIWLILKNISLLDRIWSLWLVRFAHSATNFIFWFLMLIFSTSINSLPDSINIVPNTQVTIIWTYNHLCLNINICLDVKLITRKQSTRITGSYLWQVRLSHG